MFATNPYHQYYEHEYTSHLVPPPSPAPSEYDDFSHHQGNHHDVDNASYGLKVNRYPSTSFPSTSFPSRPADGPVPSSSRAPYTPTFSSPPPPIPSLLHRSTHAHPLHYTSSHPHPMIVEADQISPTGSYLDQHAAVWQHQYHHQPEYEIKPFILPTPPPPPPAGPIPETMIIPKSIGLDVKPKAKVDMNMAIHGSVAASAGIHTPIATYAAQMVVWLWFGNYQPAPSSPMDISTSPSMNPSPTLSSDPFSTGTSLNPLQVNPSPHFTQFVARMLKITMVSHSVTLVALLYIYKLRLRNEVHGQAGSEQRPFVASLMLGNKYLDDNTYTNKTWAELSGMSIQEINRMETEFLAGMSYDLSVSIEEYQHWRRLLDGFILSREREASLSRHRSSWTPAPSSTFDFQNLYPSPLSNPVSSNIATMPMPLPVPVPPANRARSASPQNPTSLAANYHNPYSGLSPFAAGCDSEFSPSGRRKRSAVDAFSGEPSTSTAVYESMRLPSRKANFSDPAALNLAFGDYGIMPAHLSPSKPLQSSASTLGRASSLNRQIARMPEHGRRGSISQAVSTQQQHHEVHHGITEVGTGYQPQSYLPTPTPTTTSTYNPQDLQMGSAGYSALVAPYHMPAQPHIIPPQHLVFYTLAAEPHPGQDGAPRKAILHYQDPSGAITYASAAPTSAPFGVPSFPRYAQRMSQVYPQSQPQSVVSTPVAPPHDNNGMYFPALYNSTQSLAFPAQQYPAQHPYLHYTSQLQGQGPNPSQDQGQTRTILQNQSYYPGTASLRPSPVQHAARLPFAAISHSAAPSPRHFPMSIDPSHWTQHHQQQQQQSNHPGSSQLPQPEYGLSEAFAFGQPAQPLPAQFANAGPPGYAYNPHHYHHQQLQQFQQQQRSEYTSPRDQGQDVMQRAQMQAAARAHAQAQIQAQTHAQYHAQAQAQAEALAHAQAQARLYGYGTPTTSEAASSSATQTEAHSREIPTPLSVANNFTAHVQPQSQPQATFGNGNYSAGQDNSKPELVGDDEPEHYTLPVSGSGSGDVEGSNGMHGVGLGFSSTPSV